MPPKKVLIITYYWPPAGGPGVQRWLKFAKYLPELNIEPTIFTPENPSYPLLDESLVKEIPPSLNVIKTKIWEPYQWAEKLNKKNKKFKAGQFDIGENQSWKSKLSIWIRGNFFIPDARVFWVKPSVNFLEKHLKENHYDAIITTGPPHSLHLIGLGLKKKNPNLKWIADFRDPWTEISYYQHLKLSKCSDKKHRFLEQQVFENADITLATSYTDAKNFKQKGANAICITNGFDIDVSTKNNFKTEKFTLSYVGILEQLRNPKILWEVLEKLITNDENFAKDFQLKLVGKVDENIKNQWEKLKNKVLDLGYLPHQKAIEEMQNSDILLITNFPKTSSKGIIPGKLFEYLATQKNILSFGCENADVKKILQKTNAGKHFTYSEKENVRHFILSAYQVWKSGKTTSNISSIEEFSRKNLTQQLSQLI